MMMFATHVYAGELTICKGKFALCAASTCHKTGNTITTNDGVTYPEVSCTCPVLDGNSIADTSMGVMKGSCSVDDPSTQVWSLFAPKVYYPQEASGFVTTPKSKMRAHVQACPGSLAAGSANCFGMMCTYKKDPVNGTTVADCRCPIQQIEKGTEFLTEAGQGNSKFCARHPVAAPDVFDAKIEGVK